MLRLHVHVASGIVSVQMHTAHKGPMIVNADDKSNSLTTQWLFIQLSSAGDPEVSWIGQSRSPIAVIKFTLTSCLGWTLQQLTFELPVRGQLFLAVSVRAVVVCCPVHSACLPILAMSKHLLNGTILQSGNVA
ncbi:hypothetical protein BaRGS_00009287 [Batillaria attramentaria]|uniref:Uncharacterized protein n=1 Tax=Batillaria attramentaria TaxID=370345 RepID=A0ABD0LJQ2_9CAEN